MRARQSIWKENKLRMSQHSGVGGQYSLFIHGSIGLPIHLYISLQTYRISNSLKVKIMEDEEVKEHVKKKYSRIAKPGGSCDCGPSSSDLSLQMGYSKEDLENVPEASNMGLGCGNPVALASLREGETLLDLGSGGAILPSNGECN